MCEKCKNRIGFAFGTCVQCGWNELDKSYHNIQVNTKDLPLYLRYELEAKHDERIKSIYGNNI